MGEIDFRTATPEQIAAVGPAEFVRIVERMSDRQVDEVMASANRGLIIGTIFRRMPGLFRPDRAAGVEATTHWSITGRPDGGADEWTVRFADARCTCLPGHEGQAALSLTMAPVEFTKVVTKRGRPAVMFMTGRIKAKGDLHLANRIPSFFDLPEG
ncbi:SCP2 sterol-binding domain-containing protein [Terrabacter sp. NPDC080008]|uniref:SCP2 sterol-binding domain-containing protein n=1 Tax=Terrabacter sp. NPDC080008 TaxID=3155176 RepID=UPI00344FEC87